MMVLGSRQMKQPFPPSKVRPLPTVLITFGHKVAFASESGSPYPKGKEAETFLLFFSLVGPKG